MLVQGHAQMNTVRLETRSWARGLCAHWWVLQVRHHQMGRLPPTTGQQGGRSLWFKYPPRAGGTLLCPEPSLDRRARENPVPGSSVQKGTQSKGNRPGAKGEGHQGSEVTAFAGDSPGRREVSILGGWPSQAQTPSVESRLLLTSSHCWMWCWPHRQCPGNRAAGHSSQGHPLLPPASRGGQRSGPARASQRAAGTDTTQ